MKTIRRRKHCTMEGVFNTLDHICAGDIKKVAVPIGFFARARKPYCEFHASWVQGKA